MTKLRQDQQNKAAISKLSSNQSQDLSLNNSSDQKSFNSPMLSQSSTNKSTTADNILRDFINRKSVCYYLCVFPNNELFRLKINWNQSKNHNN